MSEEELLDEKVEEETSEDANLDSLKAEFEAKLSEINSNNPESELKEKEQAEEVATEVLDAPKKGKRVKKPKSKARSIIEWVLTGVFGVFFIICAIGNLDGMINAKKHYNQNLRFGYGSFLVLTNSMEPKYKVNYALITKYEDPEKIYQKWQAGKTIDLSFWGLKTVTVTPTDEKYNDPEYPERPVTITHRLREVQVRPEYEKGKGRYVFICSGINENASNYKPNQYQAFTEKELLGVVKYGSPVLGWCFKVITEPWGLLIFLLIPALYLVITSSLDIMKALKDEDEKPKTAGAGGDGKTIESLNQLSDEDRKRLKEEMLQEMMKGKGEKHEE